eukprot:5835788-Alexandrium_andersonii.AAC.1
MQGSSLWQARDGAGKFAMAADGRPRGRPSRCPSEQQSRRTCGLSAGACFHMLGCPEACARAPCPGPS